MILNSKRKIKLIIIVAIFISIDQLIKYFAISILQINKFVVIPDILEFILYFNTGIAFSLPIRGVIVPMLVLFFLSILLNKYSKDHIKDHKLSILIICLIYAGGISNLLDRFIRGAVTDYISILSFPVFNIADIYISVAAILILVYQNKILN